LTKNIVQKTLTDDFIFGDHTIVPEGPLQVKDDPELLELMIQDSKSVSNLYQPTNYWSLLVNRVLPELKNQGLDNFRRRRNSVLSYLSYNDLLPISLELQDSQEKISLARKTLKTFFKKSLKENKLKKLFNFISNSYSGVSILDTNILCYFLAKNFGEKNGAKPIENLNASAFGNPENTFFVNKKMYTISILEFYMQYAYCCKFMNFDSINSVMEIGSGFGKQAEVIKKLHPHLNFFLFDLPTSLYVCEQYLSSVFPDSVVSYRETRKMKRLPENQEGKIFIFGNWKISEIVNLKCDLFWNSASFQEMEPEVVLNYLKFTNAQTEKFVFLQERMRGDPLAKEKGKTGVLKKTTIDHYKKGLNNFRMLNMTKSLWLPRITESTYSYSFWNHNS